jgi:multiple sugar transport system permease protein
LRSPLTPPALPATAATAPFRREALWGLLLLLPVVLGLVLLNYWPAFHAFFLSLHEWDMLNTPVWVGGQNYQTLLASEEFWKSLQQTALFVAGVVACETVLALAVALALHHITRGKKIFQILAFMPYITPAMAISVIFAWLYHPEQGVLNAVLLQLHALPAPVAWLFNPTTALLAVMSLEIWKATGYNMLLLLGGLQAIPASIQEAAELDGATGVRRLWQITLPQLAPTLFLVVLMTLIHALQTFDTVYLLTQGGPNRATAVLAFSLYETAFQRFEIGQATALGYVMFIIIGGISALQWWGRKRWVWQEESL